ncbi:hypothetical protein [Actinophytocola sediminis]
MSTPAQDPNSSWAPSACTLPTVAQPTRIAEFDALFATATGKVERPAPNRALLPLPPTGETAAMAADLMVRETGCCSFFTFTLTATEGALHLEVSVPGGQLDVLDAWAARASARIPSPA